MKFICYSSHSMFFFFIKSVGWRLKEKTGNAENSIFPPLIHEILFRGMENSTGFHMAWHWFYDYFIAFATVIVLMVLVSLSHRRQNEGEWTGITDDLLVFKSFKEHKELLNWKRKKTCWNFIYCFERWKFLTRFYTSFTHSKWNKANKIQHAIWF